MLVNIEKGFLHLQCMFRLQMWKKHGNMKKNVLFSPLFLYNLALITHDATMSVNPSICILTFRGISKKKKSTMPLYFPRDVRSNNVYTKNCLLQRRKLYANGMQIHPKNTAVILNAYFM